EWSRVFATRQLCFSGLELAQTAFPLGLEAPRNESVVRIDGPIAAFGPLCAVARTLDVAPELRHGGLVIGFELLCGFQRGFKAGRRECHEERRRNRRIDLVTTDGETVLAAAVDDGFAGAVIAGCGAAAAVVHLQAPPAATAGGDALQQRRAFPHGATTVMRPRARVLRQGFLIGLERLPVDEPWVVIAD